MIDYLLQNKTSKNFTPYKKNTEKGGGINMITPPPLLPLGLVYPNLNKTQNYNF